MTVEHRDEGRIAIVVARARYTLEELRTAFEAALEPFAVGAASGLLFDVSTSRSLRERSSHDVRTMAHSLASHGERYSRRLAVVARSDAP
jgi:hypothetical protein